MFQKIVTTVSEGKSTTEKRGTIDADGVDRDMAEEMRWISRNARSERGSRILTVENTMTTIAVIYADGAVKVYQWVAE